jgi:hypothetical protein
MWQLAKVILGVIVASWVIVAFGLMVLLLRL